MAITKKVTNRFGVIKSLFSFLWKRKLYWLIPLMLILMLFAVLLIFAQATGLGPMIYPFI